MVILINIADIYCSIYPHAPVNGTGEELVFLYSFIALFLHCCISSLLYAFIAVFFILFKLKPLPQNYSTQVALNPSFKATSKSIFNILRLYEWRRVNFVISAHPWYTDIGDYLLTDVIQNFNKKFGDKGIGEHLSRVTMNTNTFAILSNLGPNKRSVFIKYKPTCPRSCA